MEQALTRLVQRALGFLSVGRLLAARAKLPRTRDRALLLFHDRSFSYAETYAEALRYAELFGRERQRAVATGKLAAGEPLAVGIYQENTPAFVFACFGAALSGDLVFGLNTGFRGETLAAVLDRGRVGLLITTPEYLEQLEQVLDQHPTLGRDNVLLDASAAPEGLRTLDDVLPSGAPARLTSARRLSVTDPMIVIYTSGTTGVPKGIACSHLKLLGAGAVTSMRIGLRSSDRGYVCMPLFHSNAWLLGIMPLLVAGGSFVVTPRFSASAFEHDLLRHGFTYMNYVGQPIHYILTALEQAHGSPQAVEAALANHPQNHFRIAHGNGASVVDREKLVRYLGMEHVYELYGSTEAVISTVVKPGDPLDSVGRVKSRKVVILNEHDQECAPAELDASGRILNYDEAVGEICAKTSPQNLFFDGYYRDAQASNKKYRNGYYRSGDLGHIRIVDGKRYLYFDGRTDDWIRKDGENFSAETVAQFAAAHREVAIAAAYGVPSPVSDERVMVALQLHQGEAFDPEKSFRRYVQQQEAEGMDPKWMPDYVRIVDDLPMSTTQKVLVRQLKKQHFDLATHPDMLVFFRERGDTRFRRMTASDYDALSRAFAENARDHLLNPSAPR